MSALDWAPLLGKYVRLDRPLREDGDEVIGAMVEGIAPDMARRSAEGWCIGIGDEPGGTALVLRRLDNAVQTLVMAPDDPTWKVHAFIDVHSREVSMGPPEVLGPPPGFNPPNT